MAEKKNNLAVWSLVLGILGVCLCGFLTGIPAIILGIKGRKKAAEMGGEGQGLATAGLVLGIVGSVLSVVVLVIQGAAIMAMIAAKGAGAGVPAVPTSQP